MFHLFQFLQEEKQKLCFCCFALLVQESGLSSFVNLGSHQVHRAASAAQKDPKGKLARTEKHKRPRANQPTVIQSIEFNQNLKF